MLAKVKYTIDGRDQTDFGLFVELQCSEDDSFKTVKARYDDFVKKNGWYKWEFVSIELIP